MAKKISSMKNVVLLSALFLIGTRLSVAAPTAPVTEFVDEVATKVPNLSPQFTEVKLQISSENFILQNTIVIEVGRETPAIKAITSDALESISPVTNFDHTRDVRCCSRKVVEKIYLVNHAIRQC